MGNIRKRESNRGDVRIDLLVYMHVCVCVIAALVSSGQQEHQRHLGMRVVLRGVSRIRIRCLPYRMTVAHGATNILQKNLVKNKQCSYCSRPSPSPAQRQVMGSHTWSSTHKSNYVRAHYMIQWNELVLGAQMILAWV